MMRAAWPMRRLSGGCGSAWWAPVVSALGLGLIVYGILRSGTWGFVQPKADAPYWLGCRPSCSCIAGSSAVPPRLQLPWVR
jgi:hypothetical protein